jgi:DNA primase
LSRELWHHLSAAPLPTVADPAWLPRVSDALPNDRLRAILAQSAVEPLRATAEATRAVVESLIARLQELTTARRIVEVKSRLQRTNPLEHTEEYNRMFGELVALEQQRRVLRERAIG